MTARKLKKKKKWGLKGYGKVVGMGRKKVT
jgi:hypothetical protein